MTLSRSPEVVPPRSLGTDPAQQRTSTSGRWDSIAEDLVFGGGEESELDVLVRGAVRQSGDPAGAGRVGVALEQGSVEIGDPGGGVFGRGEESGDHISGAAAGLQGVDPALFAGG